MFSVRTLLLAEDIVRDAASNTVTVFKLIEQIAAESFPVTIPKAMLYVLFDDAEGIASEQTVLIKFSRNDQEVNSALFSFNFKERVCSRLIIDLGELSFPEAGDAQFAIYTTDGDLLQAYKLTLALRGFS